MGGGKSLLLSTPPTTDAAHALPEGATFESHFQTMITRNGISLQLAHPLLQDWPSQVSGQVTKQQQLDIQAETRIDFPGDTATSVPLELHTSPDGHSLMHAWGETWRRPNADFASPAGWNTWDYYRWTITEEEVLKNAEFIRNDPVLSQHVKRIIIDDGWQYCYGEWEANPLFPHGMKWLAEKLTAMGFEPGIWIAPTIVEPHARIAQWQTEMLARGESNLPCLGYSCMERRGFLLDPTHPTAIQWLEELFSRFADYGYRYFKLDFLSSTLAARRFHDPSVSPSKIMSRILTPIRRVLNGRARILGCNYTFDGGTENVDAVRISGDIHAKWNAVKRNTPSIATRFWAHRRLWINDPDFALCRGPETSNDPDIERLKCCLVFVKPEDPQPPPHCNMTLADLTAEEAKTLMSLVLISGGAVNLSDKLTLLNDVGLDIVRRTVAAESGDAGIPLDLFTSELPEYWIQRLPQTTRILLINWTDSQKTLRINLQDHKLKSANSAKNFWTDALIPLHHGELMAELAPHACLLACLPHQETKE